MKIGKFAEKNKVSKDTIRHYMDLGLIVPEKVSGQYNFDEHCQKSIEEIMALKNMDFTLNDIKNISRMQSLGLYTDYQKENHYQKIFKDQYAKITEEIDHLIAVKEQLAEKILAMSDNKESIPSRMGIPMKFLKLFVCLKCKGELILFDGHIHNNQVMDGKLQCECGEEYSIEDGILNVYTSENGTQRDKLKYYIGDYINETDQHFIDNLVKGIEWGRRVVNWDHFENKVILELGSGFGFALRSLINDISSESVYIAVDHNIRKHKYLKNLLEKADCKKNVLFVCADFLQIPIKEKSVDALMDLTGTSNYSFENSHFLLDLTDRYVKKEACLIGAYLLFNNFSHNSLIDEEFRGNFVMDNIKSGISNIGYKKLADYTSDFIDRGGKYENYFTQDEKVYLYAFYGKR